MTHNIFVAADVFGVKTNFLFSFLDRPRVEDVVRLTEQVYSADCTLRRRDGDRYLFRVSKLKVYHDPSRIWMDLVHDEQLREWSQVYVFQAGHRETQSEIPFPGRTFRDYHLVVDLLMHRWAARTRKGSCSFIFYLFVKKKVLCLMVDLMVTQIIP